MAFLPRTSRDDTVTALPSAELASEREDGGVDTRAILTAAGEVAFDWDVATDRLSWDANVEAVLGMPADRIAVGRNYAATVDPQSKSSRGEAILNTKATDAGSGVRYEVQYALLPDGPRGRRLIVEDTGRWYADGKGRPARVQGVVRIINERHEREQRLLFLSRYDDLTGQLNRGALLATLGDALNGATKTHGALGFLVLAVDNFQAINEAYGFAVADQIFAAVAQRIRTSLREGDTLGRFGGNKLGVILRDCRDEDMPAAAERFQSVVRGDVIATEAGAVAVTLSAGGITLPQHARTVNEAVSRAQEALHIARLEVRGRYSAFARSPERSGRRQDNAAVSADIVTALNGHRFVLGYQPVVTARTRQLAFNEALLRIRRPDSAEIVAADFVVRAERLGLIRLVDERALELVFAALDQAPLAKLSFNVSGETIGDRDWLARLSGRLASYPGLASRMIVEITETALVTNGRDAVRFVEAVHGLGCMVAIDDFGAGYSSFRMLRDLPVDVLKIDGAYVENLVANETDQAFVRALVDLAKALGVKTVAERVNDEAAAALLTSWGVDYLQGNLIGEAATTNGPPEPGTAS